MKYKLILFFAFCSLASFSQKSININNYFSKNDLDEASISITIKDLSGNIVGAYHSSDLLVPASTMKVVTTATALELYGGKHQISTIVGIDKKDPQHIVIQGYGDPTLGSEFLGNSKGFLNIWTKEIAAKVNKSKPIKITVIDDFFGYEGISLKWADEDFGNYYAAGAYGISIYDNMYRLYLNSMRVGKTPTIVKTEPQVDLVFKNNLNINKSSKGAFIHGMPFSNNRELTGNIPTKKESVMLKGDIPDPGMFLAKSLAKKLKQAGFKVSSTQTTRSQYLKHFKDKTVYTLPTYTPIYISKSPTLKEIIRVVNVKSNNHYAEHLIRAVGRFKNQDMFVDAIDLGTKKVKSYWKSKGINTDPIIMYDGSGLSPENAISSQHIADILLYMKTKSANTEDFLASFPKAGSEGTVANVLKGTRLEGKVLAKSGSISGVQCFAGYYTEGNKQYVFSVIVNNFNSPRRKIVKSIESVLLDYLK